MMVSQSGTLLFLFTLALLKFQCGAQTVIVPNPVIITEGDVAEVTCSPRFDNGIPNLSIAPPGTDFGPIDNDDVTFQDDGMISRTFFISGLTTNDNGSHFQCTIGSTPSEPALLIVNAQCPPTPSTDCVTTIDVTVGTVRLRRGEVTCLQCGDTPMAGTTWTIDGNSLDSDFGEVVDGQQVIYDPACGIEQIGPLFIRCTPPGGLLNIQVGGVDVIVPPIVPETVTVNEGGDVDITCDISNSNGLFVTGSDWTDSSGTVIESGQTLTRLSVDRTFAGVYYCVVRSTEGIEPNSSTTVIVQYAPDVFTSIESPHLSPVDQTLSLSCTYDAFPAPDITWLQSGSPLDPADPRVNITSSDTRSDLMVSALMSSEGGEYTCEATNVLGSAVTSVTVVVQENIVQRNCTNMHFIHDSPTLTVQADGNYNLSYYFESSGGLYTCFVRDIDSCPQQERQVDCQNQVATFTDLDPGVHYVCSVLCRSPIRRIERSIQRAFFTPAQLDDCIPYFINDGISITSNSNGTANVIIDWSSSGSPSGFKCRIDFSGTFFDCEVPLSLDLAEDEQHHVTIRPAGCIGDATPLNRRFEVPVEGCALPFSHR